MARMESNIFFTNHHKNQRRRGERERERGLKKKKGELHLASLSFLRGKNQIKGLRWYVVMDLVRHRTWLFSLIEKPGGLMVLLLVDDNGREKKGR